MRPVRSGATSAFGNLGAVSPVRSGLESNCVQRRNAGFPVVLPLVLAVPGAIPALPAVIVTQTLVELLSELVYVRFMPKVGKDLEAQRA